MYVMRFIWKFQKIVSFVLIFHHFFYFNAQWGQFRQISRRFELLSNSCYSGKKMDIVSSVCYSRLQDVDDVDAVSGKVWKPRTSRT